MVRHMDRDVLLVVALLSLIHYDPVLERYEWDRLFARKGPIPRVTQTNS